ncbi:Hypothetical predicted protein [Paramuricea clavata]|uniref:Uncharacterized protein n=1 Tax=Paramuricea clavata TaxID=317549 RepID=A0A6S7KNY9_PARCT|nr:Hypothetical predicted protein [Paramuricea clavata]
MGKVPFTKSKVSYRNVSAMNLDALRADLFNSDLCKNTDMFDVNELVICYNEPPESTINRHAPLLELKRSLLGLVNLGLTLK